MKLRLRYPTFLKILIGIFVLASIQLTYAQDASSSSYSPQTPPTTPSSMLSTSQDLDDDDYIPPGFENINNDYSGDAQIRYNNEIIGSREIDFNDRKDLITLSKAAIDLILKASASNLTEAGKKEVPKALSQALAAHSEVSAPYLARSPHQVTVYFSVNMLQLDVFIPPKFLKSVIRQYQYAQFHPTSKHHPSSRTSINISRTQSKYNKANISWQAAGAISSANMSVHYQANNNLKNYFNTLYTQYIGKQRIYRLGYQQPFFTTMLAPSGNYWGVSIQDHPRLINPKFYNAYKTPLIITLDQPYYVEILQRGNILFKGNLNQGENVIKTQRFPPGSYPIEIKKRDLLSGEETTSTQMFTNNVGLYNWMYSGFQLVAGVRSDELTLQQNITQKNGYFRVQNGFNVLKGDLDFSYTYVDNAHYFGTRYDFLSTHHFDYTLAAAINNTGKLLGTANLSYKHHQSTYQFNMSNGYYPDDDTPNKANYSLSYYLQTQTWRVNAQATYNSSNGYQFTYGQSRSFRWHNLPFNISLSSTYAQTGGFKGIASLSLSLTRGNYNNSISLQQSTQTTLNDRGSWQGGADKQFYVSHSLRVPTGGEDAQADLNGRYQHRWATLRGEMDASNAHNQLSIDQTTIGIQTNLITNLKHWALTSKYNKTGFIINLPKVKDKNATYSINNRLYQSGRSVFIPGSGYSKSSVVIGAPSRHYTITPDYYESFLYPYNIHMLQLKLNNVCELEFNLLDPDNGYWHIENMPDSFVIGGEESYANVPENTTLNFVPITTDDSDSQPVCHTDIVVKCPNNQAVIQLGDIACQSSTTTASKDSLNS